MVWCVYTWLAGICSSVLANAWHTTQTEGTTLLAACRSRWLWDINSKHVVMMVMTMMLMVITAESMVMMTALWV